MTHVWLSVHTYSEIPNKRVIFPIIFENFFPPPRIFTYTNEKKNVSFPRFFTYINEKKITPTLLLGPTRLLGTLQYLAVSSDVV